MKPMNSNGVKRQSLARLGKYAIFSILSTIYSTSGTAQQTYDFFDLNFNPYHAKNYTTVIPSIVNPTTSQSDVVMAGTLYGNSCGALNNNNDPIFCGRAHFFRYDNTGAILANKTYTHEGEDERLVDIKMVEENGANYYYLILLQRSSVSILCPVNLDCSIGRDDIKVLKIDNDGNIISSVKIANQYGPDAIDRNNMYPMHSLLDEQANILYICGYASVANPLPSWVSSKKAFVISLDVSNNSFNQLATKQVDYIPSLPVFGTEYDFDMAFRIRKLNSGNIAVTGSATAQTGTTFGSSINSATLNLTLDPATLAVINDQSFCAGASPDGGNIHEYGTDILEDNTNNVVYITGNEFLPSYIQPVFNWPRAMNPLPTGLYITRINQGTAAFTSPRFKESSKVGWSLQLIPEDHVLNIASRFAIAGLTSTDVCGTGANAPSLTNIIPFILPVDISTNSTPNTITAGTYHRYNTTTGTSLGAPFSFHLLGDYYKQHTWNPLFASETKLSGSTQFAMSAPKATSSSIGVKTLLINDFSSSPYVPSTGNDCGYETCNGANFITQLISANLINRTEPDLVLELSNPDPQAIDINYAITSCSQADHKPSGISNAQQGLSKTTVYPNPASNTVFMALSQDISPNSKIEILLTNILGQIVSKLYSGINEDSDNLSINIPLVPNGLYIVQVKIDGQIHHQQKLTIQN